MNSCVLMAQIVEAPKLRYTQDNQTPVADVFVEFPSNREGDPPSRLRVVGWNNLATEIQENYQVGDRVIIHGRLQMNTIDRPEGFKEKRAELVASRFYKQDGTVGAAPPAAAPAPAAPAPAPATTPNDKVVPMPSPAAPSYDDSQDYEESPPPKPAQPAKTKKQAKPASDTPPVAVPPPSPPDDADLDDIPF